MDSKGLAKILFDVADTKKSRPWYLCVLLSLCLHFSVLSVLLGLGYKPSPERLSGANGGGSLRLFLGGQGGEIATTEPGELAGTSSISKTHFRVPKITVAAVSTIETAAAPPASSHDLTQGDETGLRNGSGEGAGQNGGLPGMGAGGTVDNENFRTIRRRIEQAKIYPNLALRQGIAGVVRVRFKVNGQGQAIETKIVESSGSAILDHATLTTIERAAPYPPVEGWITFPLRFDLALN